jgi:hypothetical protein
MPSDVTSRDLSFPQSQLVHESLDEVAKGLAEGTISRGKAIKLSGAALLGSIGLLSLFPGVAGADEGPCEGVPPISNRQCPEAPCGRCPDCLCARTVSGRKRCLDFSDAFCPETDECDRNRDCPGEEVCVRVGGCCGSPNNLCVPPCPPASECPSPPPPP